MPAVLLLEDDNCGRLVDVPDLDSCTTFSGIREALGLPKSAEVEVTFKERQLSDASAPFRSVHAPTATLTVQAVQGNLFTNGWFPAAPTRVYAKVLDLSWSPMRHADFMADLKWLLAMVLLLASIQQLLAVTAKQTPRGATDSRKTRRARAMLRSIYSRIPWQGFWAGHGAPAAASHCVTSGSIPSLSQGMSSSADMPPGSQFLASLVNYELTGLPPAAPSVSSKSSSEEASAAAPATTHSPAAGGAYDLQRMHRLLGALGDPHKRYPVLHVAGSKGKGSVVALLSCILRAAGYRVGTYSSPHLLKPQERIQGPGDGGAPISEERWEQLAQQVRAAAIQAATSCAGAADSAAVPPDRRGHPAAPASSSEAGASPAAEMPTYFEASTAMALQHFADDGADIAVMETGMGGRDDATNVCPPEQLQAAVITTLGMEHVAALGGSIQTIAAAKAGIMKPGRPLVLATQPNQEAAAVVLQHAAQLGCPVVHAGEGVQVSPAGPVTVEPSVGTSLAQQAVSIAATLPSSTNAPQEAALQLPAVPCRLVGQHQHSNIQAAVAAALLLRQQGWEVPDAAIAAGLSTAWLPGRFQVMRDEGWPYHMVLDGAHTADSAAALARAVREAFPQQPLVLVLAMAADKEHREVILALRGMRPVVVVFTAVPIAGGMQRAAPPGTLAAHWQAAAMLSTGPPFRCRELIQASLGAALEKARHELRGHGGEGVVVVTGSLHAVAAALGALG